MTSRLLITHQAEQYKISLPQNIPLHELIPAIAHKLNLPIQLEDGAFNLYYLVYEEEILPFDQTLAQLQLPERAEVLLEQTAVDPTLYSQQTDFSELDAHLHRPRHRRRPQRRVNRHHEEPREWVMETELIIAFVAILLLIISGLLSP